MRAHKNTILKHFVYKPLAAAVLMVSCLLLSGVADTSIALASVAVTGPGIKFSDNGLSIKVPASLDFTNYTYQFSATPLWTKPADVLTESWGGNTMLAAWSYKLTAKDVNGVEVPLKTILPDPTPLSAYYTFRYETNDRIATLSTGTYTAGQDVGGNQFGQTGFVAKGTTGLGAVQIEWTASPNGIGYIYDSSSNTPISLQTTAYTASGGSSACNTADFEGFTLSAADGRTTYALTKNLLSWNDAQTLATANSGRLATITTAGQNDEIKTKLGGSFTAAPAPSSGNKAWIGLHDLGNTGVWSLEGGTVQLTPSRFIWAKGSSNYTNYSATQPDDYCTLAEKQINPDRICYGEPWVTIDSSGLWSDEGDHGATPLKLKGVVEWPNTTLDCVKTTTPPTIIPDETLPDTENGTLYCKDQIGINLGVCVATTDGGKLCPLDKLPCEPIDAAPKCPTGSTLNTERDMCQADHLSVRCPASYSWDSSIDRCVLPPTCASGGVFNTITDRCETLISQDCPAGYTFNQGENKCTMDVVCADGGTYNPATDRCEKSQSGTCDNGFTLNSTSGLCEKAPTCPAGTTYNTTYNKCISDTDSVCPAGYTWSEPRGRCEKTPECTGGSSYNAISNKCETFGIPAGCQTTVTQKEWVEPKGVSGHYLSTYDDLRDPNTMCAVLAVQGYASQIDPALAGATLATATSYTCLPQTMGCDPDNPDICGPVVCNPDNVGVCSVYSANTCDYRHNGNWGTHNCVFSSGPFCSGAGVESITCNYTVGTCTDIQATVSKTWTQPKGLSGKPLSSYDDLRDPNWTCGVLAKEGLLEQSDPKLASASAWTATASECYAAGEVSLFDTRHNGVWGTSGSGGGGDWCPNGIKSLTCSYNDVCMDPPATGCSSTVTSSENPTCTGGSFDVNTDICFVTPNPCTDPGTALDTALGRCTAAASCTPGVLDTTQDKCTVAPTSGCTVAYPLDPVAGVCASPVVCNGGVFVPAADRCEASVGDTCSAGYVFEPLINKCTSAPTCPTDIDFNMGEVIPFSTEIDKCTAVPKHTCGADLTWMSTPYNKCEAIPVCDSPGVYSNTTNTCSAGTCPAGGTCKQIVGDTTLAADGSPMTWCSPNQCQDDTSGMITGGDAPPPGTNDLTDDGARNPDGTCAGQIYIFNGRDMRCIKDDMRGMIGSIAKIIAIIVLSIVSAGALGAIAFNVAVAAQAATGMSMAAASMVQSVVTAVLTSALTSVVNLGIDAATVGVNFSAWATQSAISMGGAALGAFMKEVGSSAYQSLTSGMSTSSTTTTLNSTTGAMETVETTTTRFSDAADTAAGFRNMNVNAATSAEVPFSTTGVNGSFTGTLQHYTETPLAQSATGTWTSIQNSVMGSSTQSVEYFVNEAQNTITKVVTTMRPDPSLAAQAIYYSNRVYNEVSPAVNSGMLSSYQTKKCCYPDQVAATCTPSEFEEWGLQKKGLCHVVGIYCDTKFLGMCMAHKETSCCFASKLARIIHEQGRPQLLAFGTNGGWGSPESPFCRGFTPDEFQMLDFSQINLDEYVADLTGTITTMAPNLTTYMDSVSTGASDRARGLVPAGEY